MDAIIQACNRTHTLLAGDGYREVNYQRVLAYYLQESGFRVSLEQVCVYQFGPINAGSGRMDIVAYRDSQQFIVELKVGGISKLADHMSQLRRYVKHQPGSTGLLVIFRNEQAPFFKRIGNSPP